MRWPSLRRGRHDAAVAPKDAPKEDGWSLARFILTLAVLAWALRSFIIAPFSIPSGSMLPTLYIGDYLVVAKWPYGYSRYSFPFGFPPFAGRLFEHVPKRGDVVVFRHPSEDADLIKRVIGLPGDTIEVRGGRLILNGQAVRREELPPYAMPVSANSPCKVVPPALLHVPRLSRKSARRTELHRARSGRWGCRRQLRARPHSFSPRLPDGRQS
jgi:signal peptidase I